MLQRLTDLILSGIAICFLSPLYICVALILKFTGEGKVLYHQTRVGRNNKLFSVLKFATMLENSAQTHTGTITIKNDPRVLPVGRVLRKTKINELPQLWNVIKGDMSLIGPRPLTEETFDMYSSRGKKLIYQCRPGLSGLGSIVFRNEEDLYPDCVDKREYYATNIAPQKEKLEIWYNKNISYQLYLELIFVTIVVVAWGNNTFVREYCKNKISQVTEQ